MNISISPVSKEDTATLQKISIETFTDTFGRQNPKKDLDDYLASAFNTRKLEKEITDPNNRFYFIFYGKRLAGYMKLKVPKLNSLEVERLYVKKDLQHLGLGKYLLNFAYEQGVLLRKDNIWLSVWEKNSDAFAFYKRQGFVESGARPFSLGSLTQRDVIMEKEIRKSK